MAKPDTIFAVSSGRPPAAIAVVRISGDRAIAAATRLCMRRLPAPRQATLRTLSDENGAVLDQALMLVFPGPATATGEDLVELHCHGGRAVIAAVEQALARIEGLRLAEPGEFTRRALAHGRIDLAQAEGLADLLAAESQDARRAAIASVEGRLSAEVAGWFAAAMRIAALVEAQIDFSDEDDVAQADVAAIRSQVDTLRKAIAAALARPPVERLRDGFRVVLAGPRNAGKSSLFNALVEREAAIVSPIAGTTRDRLEAAVQREGCAILLTDTAGLAEETADAIEAIGIERARGAIETADLVLWLGGEPPTGDALWIWSRADVRGAPPAGAMAVSIAWADSLADVWTHIVARARAGLSDQPAYNKRQRALVERVVTALTDAGGEKDLLIVAEHMREAGAALAAITGAQTTEAMLDALFGQFCIGK